MGERSGAPDASTDIARRQLARGLRIAFTLDSAPGSKRVRARVLLLIVVIAFSIGGVARVFGPMGLLAQSPFNLDLALRTLSAGWFEPRDLVPVTVVEIDAATHSAWGSPAVTPRDQLIALIARIVRWDPAAVVVDIDLGWGDEDPGVRALRDFLASYSGSTPLIFPKRIEPAGGGTRRASVSPLDDVFAQNSKLAWAHASFETDSSGVVRQWADWVEICAADGSHLLASIPATLAQLLDPLPAGLRPASPPPLAGSCRREDDPPGQLLLIGPRLTGAGTARMTADASAVSALAVLDPQLDRDDEWLFGDRVVLIGATHPASGDFWLTPSGVLPGVELLAHTVRFSTLRTPPGWRAHAAHRVTALAAFLLFVVIGLHLRGLAAALAYVFAGLMFVVLAIRLWSYYRVFEALEVALLLVVFYKFVQASLDMIEDWKAERKLQPAGWRGRFATLWAVCRKPDSGGNGND
jgi:CHASE2 domain-containing sensor protein